MDSIAHLGLRDSSPRTPFSASGSVLSGSVSISLFAVLGEVEPLVFDILRDTASH